MTADNLNQIEAGRLLSGRYELIQRIASGGMATVWIATDTSHSQSVAVKVLHRHLADDENFVSRFRREASSAKSLSHESIVKIIDTISEPPVEAMVMEFIEGENLRSVLDNRGKLPPREVVDIGKQVCSGLAVAHSQNITHRDVKPGNIMITPKGRVVITDFGIAKAPEDADLTSTGMLLGTAKYLAPEQVTGNNTDGRTDIYSLAVVLFECLSGKPPFQEGSDAATALARLGKPAPRISSEMPIPGDLELVIDRALHSEPALRYQTAEAFRDALASADLYSAALPPATEVETVPEAEPDIAHTSFKDAEFDITLKGPLATNWVVPLLIGMLMMLGALVTLVLLIGLTLWPDSSEGDQQPEVSLYSLSNDETTFSSSGLEATVDGDETNGWVSKSSTSPDLVARGGALRFAYQLKHLVSVDSAEIVTDTNGWSGSLEFYDSRDILDDDPVRVVEIDDSNGTFSVSKLGIESVGRVVFVLNNTGQTLSQHRFAFMEFSLA